MLYNKIHNITPRTIIRPITSILPDDILDLELKPLATKSIKALELILKEKEKEMKGAAKKLDFELAAILRDEIKELTKKVKKHAR